jgi:hypothetical protein
VTDCSLLNLLNLVVLTITAVIIWWYTIETGRLRKEAQLQTEVQNRPFLSVVFQNHSGQPYLHITNIGKGFARNVIIGDIKRDPTLEVRARCIPHIAPAQKIVPPWRVSAAVSPDDPLDEVPSEEHGWMGNLNVMKNPTVLVLTYSSIVGRLQYQTTVRIEEGAAEILDDRRVSDKGRWRRVLDRFIPRDTV